MPDDDRSVGRWVRVALLSAVLLPIVVGIGASVRAEWHPHSDRAVIAARTADVWGGDLPLVGAYSRYDFSHPGPLGNVLLAAPYELSGERPRSLLVGTLAVAGASAAVAVWLGLRRGGLPGGVAVTVACLAVMRSLGPETLRDPWNPFLPLLPMLLVVVAAWAVSTGSRWSLPVLAGAGSLVVQEHVGAAVPVVALGVWAVVAEVVARRRDPGWTAPLATTFGVALACWALPIADQLTGGGNLGSILSFFLGGETGGGIDPGARVPLDQALGIAARELLPVGPWLTGTEPEFLGAVEPVWAGWTLLVVGALVGVGVALRHRHRGPVARFVATGLVGVGAVVVGLAGVRDLPYGYLFRWTWVLAAVAWAAVGWGGASLVWARVRRPVPSWVPGLAAGALLVAGLAVAVPAWGSDDPDAVASEAVDALVGPAQAALVAGQPITFTTVGDDIGRLGGGVAYELERRGHPLAVPAADARIWGGRRADRDETAPDVGRLVIATGPGAAAMELPDVELLATFDSLDPAERVELEALQQEATERLEAAGPQPPGALPDLRAAGMAAGDIARLSDLRRRSFEAAIYLDRSSGD